MVCIFSLRQQAGKRTTKGREVIRGYYSFTPRVPRHPKHPPTPLLCSDVHYVISGRCLLRCFYIQYIGEQLLVGASSNPSGHNVQTHLKNEGTRHNVDLDRRVTTASEGANTHTHTYLYIYRVYFSDVERRNGGRTHSIPNAFIHTLFFNPPLPPPALSISIALDLR